MQVRVEGIDSLETHYSAGPKTHQPLKLAHEATDQLLEFLLGITGVVWGPSHGRVSQAKDGTRGYVLARRTGPYGRPICFVFAGGSSGVDGADVFLTPKMAASSLNYHMLSVGHAYPLFYETLFYDLRTVLANVTSRARSEKSGVWKTDKSNSWVDGTDIPNLQNKTPIFPKLFRRLVDHGKSGQPFSKLADRLAKERVTIISTVHHTRFNKVVKIKGTKVRMSEKPENLVIGTVNR